MRLRKWVKAILVILSIASLIVMASECSNMTAFVLSHVIACLVFCLSIFALIRFN